VAREVGPQPGEERHSGRGVVGHGEVLGVSDGEFGAGGPEPPISLSGRGLAGESPREQGIRCPLAPCLSYAAAEQRNLTVICHKVSDSPWAALRFPDKGIAVSSCCGLAVQVLVMDFLRSPVVEP
jgi:hypothetical protein